MDLMKIARRHIASRTPVGPPGRPNRWAAFHAPARVMRDAGFSTREIARAFIAEGVIKAEDEEKFRQSIKAHLWRHAK